MSRRLTGSALLLALLLVAAACTGSGSGGPSGSPGGSGGSSGSRSSPPPGATAKALARAVCAQTPHEVLLRTWHGTRLDRSGDIQIIPKFPNFVNGGLTHATPFDYTQEVPLLLYGPGYVKPGVYDKAITLADLAPTEGALLHFDFAAPDGQAQTQALLPAADRPAPKLLVTLIWDSGGLDLLNTWKNDWPYLKSLMADGAWFDHATVGSSPSNTPTGHAEIGTGAFPMHNGMVDEYMRLNGRIQKPNENGPQFMIEPTLADLYDRAMGNRPLVGGIATLSAHIMMMSHGTGWGGGDADLAVTREKAFAATAGAEATTWNLTSDMAPFYSLPSYVNDLPPITKYVDELDQADGALDGKWRQNDIAQLSNGFDTPARTPFQTALIEQVISTEGFGADDVPDLLYLNYKAIDTVGHLFSANGVEMSDAVRYQDQALRELVDFLNQNVGTGNWVMAVTADHGTQLDPAVSGAFMIDINKLDSLIRATFDADGDGIPLIQRVRPTEIWFSDAELADNGFTLTQVSQFLMALTQQQTYKNQNLPEPGHEHDPVFDAALPSSILSKLPCLPEARPGT